MEFNNGLLAGLPFEEAALKYPPPEGGKKPHISYYGQETLIEFRARAERMISKLLSEFPADGRIAVVSHGGMINMLFRSFLKLPVTIDVSISNGDAGIHLWKADNDNEKRQITFLNRMEHLAEINKEVRS